MKARKLWRTTPTLPLSTPACWAAAQAVEHYEISRYGTLKTWATKLGHKDAVKLLEATLAEVKEDRRRALQIGRERDQCQKPKLRKARR